MGGSGGARTLGWDGPGASRSPPAHVTAPKYPTHFLPNRTLTLQAGTRKIFSFFFSLPTPPPPSQPGSLLPLPPSLLPTLPPAPARLPPRCPGAGGRGLGGAARDAWVSAPPICWASVAPSPGGRARLAEEVSVLGPSCHPFSLALFPFLPFAGGGAGGAADWLSPLAGLWFPEASLSLYLLRTGSEGCLHVLPGVAWPRRDPPEQKPLSSPCA